MKKVVILSLILLIIVFITGNVYAEFNCNAIMEMAKTELSKNEEFTIDVNLYNVQSDRGIASLSATLEYDKDSLTLIKMEGENGWKDPSSGSSYDESNGKISINRDGLGKNDETAFRMTFKVKEESKQNIIIILKDVTVEDGQQLVRIGNVYKNATVKGGTSSQDVLPTIEDTDINMNTITSTNSSTNSTTNTAGNKTMGNTIKDGVLPKAGNDSVIFMIIICMVVILAVSLFVKFNIINNEMKD